MRLHLRYLILGLFDGLTVAFSILFSLLLFRTDIHTVFHISLAAAVGVFASNFFGSYYAESAESHAKIRRAERDMGVKQGYLQGTMFHMNEVRRTIWSSLTSSLGALAAICVPLLFVVMFGTSSLPFVIMLLILSIIIASAYTSRFFHEHPLVSVLRVLVVLAIVVVLNLFVSYVSTG